MLTPRSLNGALVLILAGAALVGCRREGSGEAEIPAGLRTRAVATSLPTGASVVVSGHDIESFWSRLQSTRLYKDLVAIQGVREAFAPLAESQRRFEAETGLPLTEETLMTLVGRRFDLGFYGRLPADRADLLFVSDVKDRARARTILETLEARVGAEQEATFREAEIAGTSARVARNRQGEDVLFYALDGERLTIATTENRLRQGLELGGGRGDVPAMTSDPEYVETLRKLPDASIAVFVNQQALREAAARAAADTAPAGTPQERLQRERFRAAATALEGYRVARAVVFGFYWTENGLRGDVYTRFPEGARPPLATMMTQSPGRIRSLAYQPVGTLLFVSMNTLDAKTIYDALYGYAVDATRIQMGVADTPDSLRADSMVVQNLQAFQRQTGIDVQSDLVAWVGQEAAFSVTGVDRSGFFPLPEVSLTVATKDRERSRAFLARMEGQLADVARARASVPLSWQAEEYQGQTVRYAPTPFGEGLSLAYAVDNEFVLVASNRGLVRRMLDARAGRAQALPSNPDFTSMTRFYPQQANMLGFVNLEQILTQVQDLMASYGQMGASAVADTTATSHRLLAALKNAPRMGFFTEADSEGLFGHMLLELR